MLLEIFPRSISGTEKQQRPEHLDRPWTDIRFILEATRSLEGRTANACYVNAGSPFESGKNLMIELINKGMNANVIALTAYGKVTHQDYVKVLIPAVEERIRTNDKVRLLYHLGEGIIGFDLEAIWDDARTALKHFTAFEKIAVVTDISSIGDAIKVFGSSGDVPFGSIRTSTSPRRRRGSIRRRRESDHKFGDQGGISPLTGNRGRLWDYYSFWHDA